MVSFPPCKINLGLQVLSRQQDGYHSIATCFYPLPWTDILEILPAETFAFSQTGLTIPGSGNDNLCISAYQILRKEFNLPHVRIHLHKIIPVGAGLGGGSSDAAHTLRTLNLIFKLRLTEQQLMHYAAQLGSDVSFFIQDEARLGRGRGNSLEPVALNLKGYFIRLFMPDFSISTAEAYSTVVPKAPDMDIRSIVENSHHQWKGELQNDFELTLFKKYPVIQQIKNELYQSGATYASMSGSGASVFGIFEKEPPVFNYSLRACWSGRL